VPEEFALARGRIDGAPLSPSSSALERVVVDDHCHAGLFESRSRDAERQVLSQAKAKIGSKVKVSATAPRRDHARRADLRRGHGSRREYDSAAAVRSCAATTRPPPATWGVSQDFVNMSTRTSLSRSKGPRSPDGDD